MATITIGPVDYGYSSYKNRELPAGTLVDLTGTTFLTRQLPDLQNAYPVNLGGGPGCRVKGARVLGKTEPEDAPWSKRYTYVDAAGVKRSLNSAAVCATGSDDFTFDSLRIHDCWDAIRVEGSQPIKWTVTSCHISRNHDDAIESDNPARPDGLIYDTLIDGSYVCLSATSNKESGRIRIEKSMLRAQPFPGAHNEGPALQPGHMPLFKIRQGHTIDLVDVILRLDQRPNAVDRACDIPTTNRDGSPQWPIGECRNTVLLWGGDEPYPYRLDSRIEIVNDPDHAIWNQAYQDWINRHPDVPRFDFDPVPVQPEPEGYRIALAPRAIAIDADLTDYADAQPIYVQTTRATLEARVMHSPAGLHFGLRVTDPMVIADTVTDKPWRQAAVEIFLDPTGDGGASMTGDDMQVIITPQGRIWPDGLKELVPYAAKLTGDGYIVEALLPWTPGRCRLSFALDDATESVLLGGDRKQFLVPDKWIVARP